jgi:hypothetical protein
METIARIYLSLPRGWTWPKIDVSMPGRSFGDALELYRKALASAYLISLFDGQTRRPCSLSDEDLEGRDPRW